MIGIVGTMILLPIAVVMLLFGFVRFAGALVAALVAAAVARVM
jgi:hypothetical protein